MHILLTVLLSIHNVTVENILLATQNPMAKNEASQPLLPEFTSMADCHQPDNGVN